ncbi:MAG: ABC transporter substrate-binding protein [Candidatus Tectomicrobia bacterium]|nr:ABC transporter substrate-binding protein [Candidatus Tectomicrobia bacterium]
MNRTLQIVISLSILFWIALIPFKSFAGSAQKDTLVIAIPGDIDNFDPPKSFGFPKQELSYNTYEMLVDFKLKKNEQGVEVSDGDLWVPWLAEKVEVSGNGTVYTFTLRQGVKFYPSGRELDANDVKWTIERMLGLKVGLGKFEANEAWIFEPDQVKVVDPRTVQVMTGKSLQAPAQNPLSLAFMRFIQFAVIDSIEAKKHATPDDPWAEKWLAEHTAGTGPYYVEMRDPGVEIILAVNPYYWGPPPQFKRVILRIIQSKADRLLLLARGAIDFDSYLGLEEVSALTRAPGVKVISESSGKRNWISVRVDVPPFDKLPVRQALAHAIPYEDIIKGAFFRDAIRMHSFIPHWAPGYDEGIHYSYDLEKAKALLAEAGLEKGFNAHLYYDTSQPEQQIMAILIQAELSKIGINLALYGLPSTQFQSLRRQKQLPGLILGAAVLWLEDPATVTNLFFLSKSPAEYSNYSNPRLDQLYGQWAFASDREGRVKGFQEVQQIVAKDLPWIYLAYSNHHVVMRQEIEGYVYYVDLLTRFYKLKSK